MGTHVHPWLFHFNVWQNPPQIKKKKRIYRAIKLHCKWVVGCSLSRVRLCDPHGLQHAMLSCPSLSPRVCSNSCSLSQWCYPTVSSPAAFFSFGFTLSQHQGLSSWHKIIILKKVQTDYLLTCVNARQIQVNWKAFKNVSVAPDNQISPKYLRSMFTHVSNSFI